MLSHVLSCPFCSNIYWMVVRKNYQLTIYPPLTGSKTSFQDFEGKQRGVEKMKKPYTSLCAGINYSIVLQRKKRREAMTKRLQGHISNIKQNLNKRGFLHLPLIVSRAESDIYGQFLPHLSFLISSHNLEVGVLLPVTCGINKQRKNPPRLKAGIVP